jgi:DNA-binding NarL/FixJ family response regulator
MPREIYLRRPLSRRRKYVLLLLGRGLTDRKVAETMGVTLGTLRNYLPQLRIDLRLSSLDEVRRLARDWHAGKIRIYAEIERDRL